MKCALTFGTDGSLDTAKYVLSSTPSFTISVLSVLYRSMDLYWQPKNNMVLPILVSDNDKEENNRFVLLFSNNTIIVIVMQ